MDLLLEVCDTRGWLWGTEGESGRMGWKVECWDRGKGSMGIFFFSRLSEGRLFSSRCSPPPPEGGSEWVLKMPLNIFLTRIWGGGTPDPFSVGVG